MKDEAAGIPITKFCGLRSKMYSYTLDGDSGATIKKCKGISKGVVKKSLTFGDYKEILFNETKSSHTMKTIRSVKHQVGNFSITKSSLSAFVK